MSRYCKVSFRFHQRFLFKAFPFKKNVQHINLDLLSPIFISKKFNDFPHSPMHTKYIQSDSMHLNELLNLLH